jgi:hypothetical protein
MPQLNRAMHAIDSDDIDTMLSREGVHPDEVLQTLLELIRAQDRLIAAQNATIEALRAEAGASGSLQEEREQSLRRELHRANDQITGLRAKIENMPLRDQKLVAEIRKTLAARRRPWWQMWNRNP